MGVIAKNEFSAYETGSSVLSSKILKGCWRDTAGNMIEESFWGNTVRLYIVDEREEIDKILLNSVNIEISIKTNNATEKIPMPPLKYSFLDIKTEYVEIRIKDRWELSEALKRDREATLICEISAGFAQKHSSSIKISEFKVENGFITDGPFIVSLPQGKSIVSRSQFSGSVNGIILHRTAGSTVESALGSGFFAHFYVDKNGNICQPVSFLQEGTHVGRIRPRGEPNTPSTETVHAKEVKKSYPDRYPYNIDSVGIEVVGRCLDQTEGKWEDVEAAQAKSTARLTNFLVGHFFLNTSNIYAHETISSKTANEGQVVYDAINNYLINV